MAISSRISIPQSCAQPWAAMVPSANGRHCAACATEVVDFTRMSDAEILAFMKSRQVQPVCALMVAPAVEPQHPKRVPGLRRWVLAGLALLGWHPLTSCVTNPPKALPAHATTAPADPAAAQTQQLIITGQVFDGNSKTAVAQVRVFINGSQYGTVTDEQGRFELRMLRNWELIASGTVELRFVGNPFDFK
jgi:hypothetical protein